MTAQTVPKVMRSDPAGLPSSARRRGSWLLGVAMVAAPALIAALPVVGFREGQAIGFLALVPLAASMWLPWRRTAAVGAYTVAVGLALLAAEPSSSRGSDGLRLSAVAVIAVAAAGSAALLRRREQRLREVSEVARITQAALQPPVPSRLGTWSLAGHCESAAVHAQVGGDVLEVVACGTGARVLLGDARGSGLPAVRLAAAARARFREVAARAELPLAEVARLVDLAVADCGQDEDFMTALFLELDADGWVQVVNCGHPPPLRRTSAGGFGPLSPRSYSPPLGLGPQPRCDVFAVAPGEHVLAFTDGLLEARDAAGQMLDPARLAPALIVPGAPAALAAVVDAVHAHAGSRLEDDVAVLVAALEPDDGAHEGR